MIQKAIVLLAHPVIIVEGDDDHELPLTLSDSEPVEVGWGCLVVGTQHAMDGNITLILTDQREAAAAMEGVFPVFRGSLPTPAGAIRLSDSENTIHLQSSVVSAETAIEIWANHYTQPDVVVIVHWPAE